MCTTYTYTYIYRERERFICCEACGDAGHDNMELGRRQGCEPLPKTLPRCAGDTDTYVQLSVCIIMVIILITRHNISITIMIMIIIMIMGTGLLRRSGESITCDFSASFISRTWESYSDVNVNPIKYKNY